MQILAMSKVGSGFYYDVPDTMFHVIAQYAGNWDYFASLYSGKTNWYSTETFRRYVIVRDLMLAGF